MIVLLATILSSFAAEYGPAFEGEVLPGESLPPEEDTGVVGCSDQSLDDGEVLPDLPLFYTRAQPDHSWGSADMINLIVETSRHMRWLLPTASPITIGDISAHRGGYLSGHLSHRGGVDADVGIYREGGWQDRRGFTRLGDDFDLEANWALMSAMLDTGKVDFLLIDQSHINRLKKYTLAKGLLSEEEVEEIFPSGGHYWERTGIVRHAPNHLDHVHVRVLCGDGSRAR